MCRGEDTAERRPDVFTEHVGDSEIFLAVVQREANGLDQCCHERFRGSEHIGNPFAVVLRVADDALVDRIDDEVKGFKRELTDENGERYEATVPIVFSPGECELTGGGGEYADTGTDTAADSGAR